MRHTVLILFMVLGGQSLAGDGEPEVLLHDSLKGKLAEGWEWLRENPKTWRHTENGLEIRVEPGLAATVKNALVRKAPDRSQGKYALEVTVEFTAAKAGVFPIICQLHPAHVGGQLVVLP